MAKFLGLQSRFWLNAMFAVWVFFIAYITLAGWVANITAEPERAYLTAVLQAEQNDAGLRELRWDSVNDPAFTEDGLLTEAVRSSRCAAALTSLDRFQKQWLNADSYQGKRIQTHLVAAVFASHNLALASRNGCIPPTAFATFLAGLETIRDADLGVHSLRDLATWLPLPERDGFHFGFYTIHGFRAAMWAHFLSPDQVQVMNCTANVHCDVRSMLHQKFGAQA